MEDYRKIAIELGQMLISKAPETREDVERMLPELREGEDERVRKEITELVMQPTWKTEKEFYRRKELCAWLEKQGENTYNKELSELLHKVICRFINAPDIPYSDREKVSMKVLPYVERLEKQGEHKSDDKVEPKFKVGDWITIKE